MQGLGDLLCGVRGQLGDVELAFGHLLGDMLRVEAGFYDGVAEEVHHSLAEHALFLERIDQHVWQGHLIGVDAVDAKQAAQGALHGHR